MTRLSQWAAGVGSTSSKQFAFYAVRDTASLVPSGYANITVEGTQVQGLVKCLKVVGRAATVGIQVERSSNPAYVGKAFWFSVAAGAPNLFSNASLPKDGDPGACMDPFAQAGPGTVVQQGSVVVNGSDMTFENQAVRYVVGGDGRNLHFVDKQSGTDYCWQEPNHAFLRVRKGGVVYSPSACWRDKDKVIVQFQDAGVTVVLNVATHDTYFRFEVAAIEGSGVKEVVLSDLHLTITDHLPT